MDWDDAYANAAHIPDGARWPGRWAAAAAAFRAGLPPDRARTDLAYGRHPREKADLFRPEGRPRGLVVFVHGGYWRAFGPQDFSHLAAGAMARGWVVVLPGYPLAPERRVGPIVRSVAVAIGQAAATVPGQIRLAGHSAGGHLAARMVCGVPLLQPEVARRVERVVSISGLHDLRPLRRTAINADLRLDADEARAESPALLDPVEGARLHAWVGAGERPEYLRQAALIANVWAGCGAATRLTIAPSRHHFDVIADLEAPESELVEALAGE
jgi:arylformamidase